MTDQTDTFLATLLALESAKRARRLYLTCKQLLWPNFSGHKLNEVRNRMTAGENEAGEMKAEAKR